MFFHIRNRTSSFLGSATWRTEPWKDGLKGIDQTLYDHAFRQAALLEDIDKSTSGRSGDMNREELLKLLRRGLILDRDFDTWHLGLLHKSSMPLYCDSGTAGHCSFESVGPTAGSLTPYLFPNLQSGLLAINLWGLRLNLSGEIDKMRNILQRGQQHDPWATGNHRRNAVDAYDETYEEIGLGDPFIEKMTQHHDHGHRLKLAVDITRAALYCTGTNMGLVGLPKSLFALRVALWYLRRHPGPEFTQCWALYQDLSSRRGMQIAQDLQDAWLQSELDEGTQGVC
jgi:hypothetical protein